MLSDYLSFFIIAPLFLIVSSGINVFIITQIAKGAQNFSLISALSPFILFILKFFPFFLAWVLFTFIYAFMPNKKADWKGVLLAGMVAGTLFQLWQAVYIHFQLGASSYGAVYGSFVQAPFLIWLLVSWLIVLAGAELAFHFENTLHFPHQKKEPLPAKTVALLIMAYVIEAFDKGHPPLTEKELSRKIGITLYDLQNLLEPLCKNDLLAKVSNGYQPAQKTENITPKMVYAAIDNTTEIQAFVQKTVPFQKMEKLAEEIEKSAFVSVENKPLLE